MIQDIAGMLAGQDFGTWSRADIERIAAAAGWTVQQEQEYRLTFVDGGSLSAHATRSSPAGERGGFGDLADFAVTEKCDPAELAGLHAATLAAVVAVLGPPALVGGPGAWAFWRQPRVRVERDMWSSTVTVRVEPAEAAENEEYRDAEYMPDWKPGYLWYVEPDVNSAAGRSLLGMMFYEAPLVTTWDEFEKTLRELFVSFAVDVPALADHASHILWSLTPETREREVEGLFQVGGVTVFDEVVFNVSMETGQTRLPPGEESGLRAAEMALEVVRGWGLGSPENLRHRIYAPPPSHATARSGFRIGVG